MNATLGISLVTPQEAFNIEVETISSAIAIDSRIYPLTIFSNMQAFVETILSRLAETEDLTLLHPKSTWQIYEATVKEGKHEHPDYWDPEV